jgi:hypothetical protein
MNDNSEPQENIQVDNNKEIIKLNINFLSPSEAPDEEKDMNLLAKFYFIFSEIGISLMQNNKFIENYKGIY